MTKPKAPDMPSRLPDIKTHHKYGDCKCERLHVSIRSYLGYPLCLICGNLTTRQRKVRKNADMFYFFRRRLKSLGATQEQKAVAYLRQMIDKEQSDVLRLSFELLDREQWYAANHHRAGRAYRNLLRKVGFGDQSFEGGSLDDTYRDLLAEVVRPGKGGSS